MKSRFALTLLAVLALSACTVKSTKPDDNMTDRLSSAATSPLEDLNLLRTKIPPVLVEARNDPYRMPQEVSCEAITQEVRELDDALGPDIDGQLPEDDAGWFEDGTSSAKDATVSALRGVAEGLLPYRGWVRKLTGAEKLSKLVASSVRAGTTRRAFLKGLGKAHDCAPPASPLPLPDKAAPPASDSPAKT